MHTGTVYKFQRCMRFVECTIMCTQVRARVYGANQVWYPGTTGHRNTHDKTHTLGQTNFLLILLILLI